MSIPQAAGLSGDSPGWWGHIERGYQPLGRMKGRRLMMHPEPKVLARMSYVVGVTPVQWEARGRGDVAAELHDILADARRHGLTLTAALSGAEGAFLAVIRSSPDLTEAQKAEFARLWHQQGGRQRVAEVARRMLGGLTG